MGITKAKDANLRFLFGSVFFFFILLMMIVLFAYFTLQQSWGKDAIKESYTISFSKQFEGACYDLYLNDSLLYVGNPVSSDTSIVVSRTAQENALIVVDKKSDDAAILQVKESGMILICYGKDGDIVAETIGK
jgi:hypothetical protein